LLQKIVRFESYPVQKTSLPQTRAFESITTSCKYEGHEKSFEPQWTNFFIVYVSVKGTYLAYSYEQIVEVTSL